jgi:hypothetical protein
MIYFQTMVYEMIQILVDTCVACVEEIQSKTTGTRD